MFRHMTAARWALVTLVMVITAARYAYPSQVLSALMGLLMLTGIIYNRRQRGEGWWG